MPRQLSKWLFLVTLLAAAAPALAQRVVVLEIDGDRANRLRDQVETALRKAGKVEVVSIHRYKEVAAKKRLKTAKAMTPGGVAQMSRFLPFEAAVGGTVADTFFVRILDPGGQELWSKDLPVRGGLISADNARRLASAIFAAANSTPKQQSAPDAEASSGGGDDAESPQAVTPERKEPEAQNMPGLDVSKPEESADAPHDATVSSDSDLEAEIHKKGPRIGPKMARVILAGTTTWRSYCSRPGVTSCAAYDAIPAGQQKPTGDIVTFSAQVPYAGIGVSGELFPFASFDNLAKGLGVAGTFGRGFSLTNVNVTDSAGNVVDSKQVISTDDTYFLMGLFRYYFAFGGDQLSGYVGLRAGLDGKTFNVDPGAHVALPGSHRHYPAFGLDASVPLAKLVRVEAQGLYFLNPAAGPDEVVGYGQSATGSGWSMRAGIAGDVWGPFGYVLHFMYESYADHFVGTGNLWPNGGAAQENYTGLYWGVSAAF